MSIVTLFHDVSHYQANYHPSGPTVAKATEGTGYIDPEYTEVRARCAAAGYFFAGYHFLRTGSIVAQAQHAYNVIGPKTPAMLDVETEAGTWPTFAQTVAFIDEYRALGGILYGVYLPEWFWSGQWHSPELDELHVRGCFTLASSYGHGYAPSAPGWAPYGGIKPSVLQYTSIPIDTNAFYGTAAELSALFHGGVMPTVDLSAASIAAIEKAVTAAVVAAIPNAVWDADRIVNPPQRPDAPGHVPAPKDPNPAIQTDNALSYTVANSYTLIDAVAALPAATAKAVVAALHTP